MCPLHPVPLRQGESAKTVARALRAAGVRRAYTLAGGFKAWQAAGLGIKQVGGACDKHGLVTLKADGSQADGSHLQSWLFGEQRGPRGDPSGCSWLPRLCSPTLDNKD